MSGSKLRKEPPSPGFAPSSPRRLSPSPEPLGTRPLRIVASGAIFLNHTINVPAYPEENANIRAQAVTRLRGGSAAACLSMISQFAETQSWLVAPIGSGPEGSALRVELEREGISTRLCARRESADGVPKAFVIKSNGGSQTVINYNPIPDITHEEFFRLIGPLLYSGRPTDDSAGFAALPPSPPLDWVHFEGRDIGTTSQNLAGLDSWLKEKDWRNRVALSVDLGKPGRTGLETLIPHADVIFFSKSYATARNFSSPRTFLLSMRSQVPPHSLLVCDWGRDGGAILSVPTREYFQSSSFVPDPNEDAADTSRISSVRSSSAGFSWSGASPSDVDESYEYWDEERKRQWARSVDKANSSGRSTDDDEELDEGAGEDTFIAGIIFALSRRMLPGLPYSPRPTTPTPRNRNLSPYDLPPNATADATPLYEGRWRLDECLRFATELAGRRMRRRTDEGLALVMERLGWSM